MPSIAGGFDSALGQSAHLSDNAGRLSDERYRRPRDLRRQGEKPAIPGRQLFSQSRGRRTPHGRTGARNSRYRFSAGGKRSRRPADRSPAGQRHSAEIQPGSERRQNLSVPGNLHPRRFSPRRIHPRAERARHEALWSVRQRRRTARGDSGAAKDFQIPHLQPGHRRRRRKMAMVSPVPAGVDPSMHRAVQFADFEGRIRPRHSPAADVPGRERSGNCSTK